MADGDLVLNTVEVTVAAGIPEVVQIPVVVGATAPTVVEVYNSGPGAVWAHATANADTGDMDGWSFIPAYSWKRLRYKGPLADIDSDLEATPNDLAVEVSLVCNASTADVVIEALA